jgi:sulfoxide reductase heme-binding subunit YedZ
VKALLKILLFTVSFIPAGWLFYAVYQAFTGGENLLGPDPATFLSHETGQWGLRFLIIALALTPLRYLFNWPYAWQLRRMMGLYALFYATLHVLVFLQFQIFWRWADIGREIVERPYITVGFAAFVLMIPLGITSFKYLQRRMGRNWKRLHRAVYAINILALVHLFWQIRSSYAEFALYGSLVAFFLVYRMLRTWVTPVRKFTFFPPRQVQR